MLYLNVKLTSSIKDCMASLSQCWGPTSSSSIWGALSVWARMFSKKKVRWSHPPSPNLPVKGLGSSGGRSHCIKVLPWGTGRSRTSSLYGPHLDHCGGCVPWRRSLLEGKKGFYLTIYRRSFRNMKYLSAKWGKSEEGLKSCRKNTWGLQLPGK